jgi:ABC-2 type transport system permease protein
VAQPESVPVSMTASGVIHDIGYRNYDGPRLGRWYLVRSLFSQSLRGAYGLGRPAKSKVMPVLLFGAMLFPALIIVVVTIVSGEAELPLAYTDYIPVTFYISAIFVAAQSPQLVSRDLRFRMVPLYFSRPITYVDYVLAKYAAMTAALLILLGAPILLMYGGAVLADLPFWTQTRGALKGLAAVALYAVVLAGIGLAIASATPRRGFGVAGIITIILVSYTVVSSVQGISISNDNLEIALYAELFTPYNLVNSTQLWMFGADQNTLFVGLPTPEGWQGALFVATVLAVVAAAAGFLLLRYRKAAVK